MKLRTKSLGADTTLFELEGEFDFSDKELMNAAVDQAEGAGSKWLLFDMSAVSYTDSVAVGTLIRGAKRVAPRSGDVAVIGAQPQVARIFEISGTTELLNVVGTVAEARARLAIPAESPDRGDGEAS